MSKVPAPSPWELAAEAIAVKIRWFGLVLGYVVVNVTVYAPERLAVLNACEGARQSSTDPFSGVAQALVQQGLPAVVAMQFEITDVAAQLFSQDFYAALADNYPIDAALAQARLGVFPDPEAGRFRN